jgi:hypothetical protein
VLALLGTGFGVLRVEYNGPNLADKLASYLNQNRRGRVEIGSVEWQSSDLTKLVTGGWIDITVRDVKVWDDCALGTEDPEALRLGDPNEECTPDDKPIPGSKKKPRKLLLWTDEVTAQLDIHALLFGSHDAVLRHVTLHGGEALIEQTREPYPLTAYNRTIVTILSAFYARMKAGFRAGIYAEAPPPIIDLRDIHLIGVNLTVHVAPKPHDDGTIGYGMAARLEDVDVAPDPDDTSAYLYMDGRDPLVQKFYVHLGVHAKLGHVRILDSGPRAAFRIPHRDEANYKWGAGRDDYYDLEVRDIDLRRLAQLPTEWTHGDFVANTLELDGTLHTIPCGDGGKPEDGATVHIGGGLLDYWDRPYDGQWAFDVALDNLGPTVRSCIKKTIGGDHMGGKITLSGPFVALPRVGLDIHDVDVDIPISAKQDPIRLEFAKLEGWIDLVNDQGAIDQAKAIVPSPSGGEPGEALVSATFGLTPLNAQADLDITKPIDVGRFLPPQVASSVGRLLTGKLKIGGDVEEGISIHDFDLALGPTAKDRVASVSRGNIFAKDYFDYVELNHIWFRGGRTYAEINGKIKYVDPPGKRFVLPPGITIDGDSPDLGEWLKRFGIPQLPLLKTGAGGGGTHVVIGPGPLGTTPITVSTSLTGVPCLGSVNVVGATRTPAGIVTFHVTSAGLGGSLEGTGRIDTNPIVPMLTALHLDGKKLDASKLCGAGGNVTGTIDSIAADVHGSLVKDRSAIDWASLAKVYATASHMAVEGEAVSDLAVCLNRTGESCHASAAPSSAVAACSSAELGGGACVVANARRDLGGTVEATVANVPAIRGSRGAATPAHLAGNLKIDDIPLSILDPVIGPGILGGLFSAALDLQGTLAPTLAPQADGTILVLRSWVKQAFVGDAQLRVIRTVIPTATGKMPGIEIDGQLLSDRIQISASLGSQAPYPVDLRITGQRVEVDQFVDLAKKLGISEPLQAWVSGTVSVHGELQPKGGKPVAPEAWVELTELEAVLDHTSRDGRRVPLRVELVPGAPGQYAMSLHVTPTTVELACRNPSVPGGRAPCPAKLDTPAGVVAIEGHATQTQMNLTARGDLDLAKLAPLLETQVDDLRGVVALDGVVTGTVGKPSWQLALSAKDGVTVRPVGSDTDLQVVPGARVVLANEVLTFEQLAFGVKAEGGVLNVRGTIGLDGLDPARWNVQLDGQVPGKILPVLTPSISQATGFANIDGKIALTGTGKKPLVDGAILFGSASPLALTARDVRHELELVKGRVAVHSADDTGGHRTYTLTIPDDDERSVRVMIDGEGSIDNVRGAVALRDNVPITAQLDFDAQNVPYRNVDRTLDLTLAADNIDVRLAADGTWKVAGDIAIVGGKFSRNFDLTQAVIRAIPSSTLPVRSLFDEFPALGNADLDLTLDVRRFAIDDNVAKIDFQGHAIAISGSPRDPRLAGSIVVAGREEFQIPLTRAKFTQTTGSIDFSPNERATNPRLEITSVCPSYQDLSGQQHRITLQITGTAEQPLWDLSTSTGLDKSQTLALLFLGRSPDQLRRSLGDTAPGANPTAVDPSTNPSTGVGDELVKDLAGDWITGLLGPSIAKQLLNIDLTLRFEVGFGTVGLHAELKAYQNVSIVGEGEETIRGQNGNASLVLRTPWRLPWITTSPDNRLSVQGTALTKQYSDPADQAQNITDIQGKVVYRLFIP